MAGSGFFDNMGSGPSSGSAVDYARNGATNPGAVPATGFYDRMFGHKRGPGGGGGKNQPPAPLAPSGNPAHTPPIGSPAISSGPGLIKRIMASIQQGASYNVDGQPLVPGLGKTVPEMMQDFGRNTQQLLRAAHQAVQQASPAVNQNLPARGVPQGGPPPGAAMPPMGGPGRIPGGLGPQPPMGGPGPMPQGLGPMPQGRPAGFFAGGYARGGYPANLMMGLPMRRARGDYVPDQGHGDGRADNVNARLSPGEYVMDAETVAMLGNGNNQAGARKLDQMRKEVRMQKGRALAKGKFSPDAKDPKEYL